MSDTPNTPPEQPPNYMQRGALAVSILSGAIFLGLLVVVLITHNDTILNLLAGAAIANMTAVVQYWMGSSAGSARKTELLQGKQ